MTMTTHSRIDLREAREQDLDRVIDVLQAANREFEPGLPPSFYRAYLANVLAVRSRLAESQLLVADQGTGSLVGTITLYPDASKEGWGWPSGWAGIRAVAVEPSARGLGIGRRLAEACITRSRGRGAPTICLHTAPFMEAATRMYESVGFRRAPEFDGDAGEMLASAPIAPRIPALAYRLDLSDGDDARPPSAAVSAELIEHAQQRRGQ
jgi:ribosomal protein S18 acetylase RimI-like enzyme